MPDFGPAYELSAEENRQRWERSSKMTFTDDLAVVRGALVVGWDERFPGSEEAQNEALAALDRIERSRQSWVDECAALNDRLVNAEGRAYRYKARLAEAERVLRDLYEACQEAEAAGAMVERAPVLSAGAYLASREQED